MSMTMPTVLFGWAMAVRTSSWKASARSSRSSMWTVARRTGPIRRMGIAPSTGSGLFGGDRLPDEGKRQLDPLGEAAQGVHGRDVHPELHDGARDLGADAGEDRLGADEPDGGGG